MDHINGKGTVDTDFLLATMQKAHKHVQLTSVVNAMNEMVGFCMLNVAA